MTSSSSLPPAGDYSADIAIAVHPKSTWKKFIGKKVLNPITQKAIPVISDLAVDLTFEPAR